MLLSAEDLYILSQSAIDAACEAGQLITRRANETHDIQNKSGGDSRASQVVTEVDLLSEAIIVKYLLPTCERYDLALLTEESADDGERLTRQAFWCVDPLDGTLAFIETNSGYSVSIALVSQAGIPLIGVVYDPVTKTLYSAVKGQGVFINGAPFEPDLKIVSNEKPLTLVCDGGLVKKEHFSDVITQFESIAEQFGLSGVHTIINNGAVMNACHVLENSPGCYFKRPKPQQGGGCLWDFAATACLFHEMGMTATDFYGYPLELNRAESVYMNHRGVMFATDAEMGAAVISALSG